MASSTYSSMKNFISDGSGYAEPGNLGYTMPMYAPVTRSFDEAVPAILFNKSSIAANTNSLSPSINRYPPVSTPVFHSDPMNDFISNQDQFQDHHNNQRYTNGGSVSGYEHEVRNQNQFQDFPHWLNNQQYTNDGSVSGYENEVRYQNQFQDHLPGSGWDIHNNYDLATGQTQEGTYMSFANHPVAEPRFSSGHPPPALPGHSILSPMSIPMPKPKPYACSYSCGKSYARKGDMERHARSHQQPEFWCVVNGCKFQKKGFSRKDKWVTHMKTHGIKMNRNREEQEEALKHWWQPMA